MASPPCPRISSTTSLAGPDPPALPSRSTPRSLTTTCAPSAANASACARPRPRPAPVMMTTRPSQLPTVQPLLDLSERRIVFGADDPHGEVLRRAAPGVADRNLGAVD